MPRLTSARVRFTGHDGARLPPRPGGGDNGRGDGDSTPNSMSNYGERLRHAQIGLAVAMTPILVLFIAFTAVYLVRRVFLSFDASRNV
jgi:hypothetical protein